MEDTHRTAELRRKLEKDPGSRLFAQFAEELRKEGRHDEAISVARKGLEKQPNYPSARLTLARSLQDSGRPAEARPELEVVVKASPDNIMAGRLLGEVLEELGQFQEAQQQFEKTLRFAPGDKALAERIAALKLRLQPAPSPTPVPRPAALAELPLILPLGPEVAVPSVSAPGSSLRGVAMPEVAVAAAALPAAPTPSAEPPSVPVPELPVASVPDAPQPPVDAARPAAAPPTAAAVAVALDRDLASGTLSPGALTVSELMHFEAAAGSSLPDAPPPPESSGPAVEVRSYAAIDRTVAFSDLPEELPAVPLPPLPVVEVAEVELPSVETGDEIGAQTLPLTSMTLADLYLQQGLKAEASAVLSQVIKEEPENKQARSKFAAVEAELGPAPVEDPSATEPAPPLVTAAPWPRRTKSEIRGQTILSLRALQSAVEREALQQKATEQRPF